MTLPLEKLLRFAAQAVDNAVSDALLEPTP